MMETTTAEVSFGRLHLLSCQLKTLVYLNFKLIFTDWSDEENCPKKQSSCTATEFRCNDGKIKFGFPFLGFPQIIYSFSGTCISNRWRCDLEQDCDSGEDEKNCTNTGNEYRNCTSDEFTCQDKRCILKSWICDGIADCKRGEDEVDCKPDCEIGQLACPPVRANVSSQR